MVTWFAKNLFRECERWVGTINVERSVTLLYKFCVRTLEVKEHLPYIDILSVSNCFKETNYVTIPFQNLSHYQFNRRREWTSNLNLGLRVFLT